MKRYIGVFTNFFSIFLTGLFTYAFASSVYAADSLSLGKLYTDTSANIPMYCVFSHGTHDHDNEGGWGNIRNPRYPEEDCSLIDQWTEWVGDHNNDISNSGSNDGDDQCNVFTFSVRKENILGDLKWSFASITVDDHANTWTVNDSSDAGAEYDYSYTMNRPSGVQIHNKRFVSSDFKTSDPVGDERNSCGSDDQGFKIRTRLESDRELIENCKAHVQVSLAEDHDNNWEDGNEAVAQGAAAYSPWSEVPNNNPSKDDDGTRLRIKLSCSPTVAFDYHRLEISENIIEGDIVLLNFKPNLTVTAKADGVSAAETLNLRGHSKNYDKVKYIFDIRDAWRGKTVQLSANGSGGTPFFPIYRTDTMTVFIPFANEGDSCAADENCASGYCISSVCRECDDDEHCSSGEFCNTSNVCETPRSNGSACRDDAWCSGGFCIDSICGDCMDDTDCASGLLCEAGICIDECDSGSRRPNDCSCTGNGQCDSGLCFDFSCTDPCAVPTGRPTECACGDHDECASDFCFADQCGPIKLRATYWGDKQCDGAFAMHDKDGYKYVIAGRDAKMEFHYMFDTGVYVNAGQYHSPAGTVHYGSSSFSESGNTKNIDGSAGVSKVLPGLDAGEYVVQTEHEGRRSVNPSGTLFNGGSERNARFKVLNPDFSVSITDFKGKNDYDSGKYNTPHVYTEQRAKLWYAVSEHLPGSLGSCAKGDICLKRNGICEITMNNVSLSKGSHSVEFDVPYLPINQRPTSYTVEVTLHTPGNKTFTKSAGTIQIMPADRLNASFDSITGLGLPSRCGEDALTGLPSSCFVIGDSHVEKVPVTYSVSPNNSGISVSSVQIETLKYPLPAPAADVNTQTYSHAFTFDGSDMSWTNNAHLNSMYNGESATEQQICITVSGKTSYGKPYSEKVCDSVTTAFFKYDLVPKRSSYVFGDSIDFDLVPGVDGIVFTSGGSVAEFGPVDIASALCVNDGAGNRSTAGVGQVSVLNMTFGSSSKLVIRAPEYYYGGNRAYFYDLTLNYRGHEWTDNSPCLELTSPELYTGIVGPKTSETYHVFEKDPFYIYFIAGPSHGTPISASVFKDGAKFFDIDQSGIADGKTLIIAPAIPGSYQFDIRASSGSANAVSEALTVVVHEKTETVTDDVLVPVVYVISKNDNATDDSDVVYRKIIDNMSFFTNLKNPTEGLIASVKRDYQRFGDAERMYNAIERYYRTNGSYPLLQTGTFIPGMSVSTWPSWLQTFGSEIGIAPLDPINRFGNQDNKTAQSTVQSVATPSVQEIRRTSEGGRLGIETPWTSAYPVEPNSVDVIYAKNGVDASAWKKNIGDGAVVSVHDMTVFPDGTDTDLRNAYASDTCAAVNSLGFSLDCEFGETSNSITVAKKDSVFTYYDPVYGGMHTSDAENRTDTYASYLANYLASAGATVVTAEELPNVLDQHDAGSILIMAHDIVPDTVIDSKSAPHESDIRSYMERGGTVLSIGAPFGMYVTDGASVYNLNDFTGVSKGYALLADYESDPCPGHDPNTCWSSEKKSFACPYGSSVYMYQAFSRDKYQLSIPLENPSLKWGKDIFEQYWTGTNELRVVPYVEACSDPASLAIHRYGEYQIQNCGDGIVQLPSEMCELGDVRNACDYREYYRNRYGGYSPIPIEYRSRANWYGAEAQTCNNVCGYDLIEYADGTPVDPLLDSKCEGFCGDNVRQSVYEACDGSMAEDTRFRCEDGRLPDCSEECTVTCGSRTMTDCFIPGGLSQWANFTVHVPFDSIYDFFVGTADYTGGYMIDEQTVRSLPQTRITGKKLILTQLAVLNNSANADICSHTLRVRRMCADGERKESIVSIPQPSAGVWEITVSCEDMCCGSECATCGL